LYLVNELFFWKEEADGASKENTIRILDYLTNIIIKSTCLTKMERKNPAIIEIERKEFKSIWEKKYQLSF
jgi:hypothetical protein